MKFIKIRSKNHTANGLRRTVRTAHNILLRLGSMTPTNQIFPNQVRRGEQIIELNTVEACKVSGNKILMKQRFDEHEVKTAKWIQLSNWNPENFTEEYPYIIKHKHSSKGNGIYYITNEEELRRFISEHTHTEDYILEKYHTYTKEYRLHVYGDGCFYTCRKMLRTDATDRWHRHDSNSVWILEENELFSKPSNWDAIVAECVKAKNAVGLDICAVDIKVQNESHREEPKFIILETNSAPSLGEITTQKYIEKLTEISQHYDQL